MRSIVKVAALTMTILLSFNSPASADPHANHPASRTIYQAIAHKVADYAAHEYLAVSLTGKSHVARCKAGPRLWRCPTTVHSKDTVCMLDIWVWSDEPGHFFFEFHRMDCHPI